MNGKRAIMVLGPEASGTRLVTRILIAAGCMGDGGHDQRLDWEPPTADLIVWRRSLPHDNVWPDIACMVRYLRLQGYEVSAIVTDRSDEPMIVAQARDHVAAQPVAVNHIGRARMLIETVPLTMMKVRYEDLIEHIAEVVAQIASFAEVPVPSHVEDIYDGNRKYVGAQT